MFLTLPFLKNYSLAAACLWKAPFPVRLSEAESDFLKALMSNKGKWEVMNYNLVYMISGQKNNTDRKSLRKTGRHAGTLSYITPLGEVCVVADCVLTVCVRELTLH